MEFPVSNAAAAKRCMLGRMVSCTTMRFESFAQPTLGWKVDATGQAERRIGRGETHQWSVPKTSVFHERSSEWLKTGDLKVWGQTHHLSLRHDLRALQ